MVERVVENHIYVVSLDQQTLRCVRLIFVVATHSTKRSDAS